MKPYTHVWFVVFFAAASFLLSPVAAVLKKIDLSENRRGEIPSV
jgi:hypothetical protein